MPWTPPSTLIKTVLAKESSPIYAITKTISFRIIFSWTTYTLSLKRVSTLLMSWNLIFLIILLILTTGQVNTPMIKSTWDHITVQSLICSLRTQKYSMKIVLKMLLVTSTMKTPVAAPPKESILAEFTKSNMFSTWFQVSVNTLISW